MKIKITYNIYNILPSYSKSNRQINVTEILSRRSLFSSYSNKKENQLQTSMYAKVY